MLDFGFEARFKSNSVNEKSSLAVSGDNATHAKTTQLLQPKELIKADDELVEG